MRLVSWNCHHGECRQRATQLDSLRPDVMVLQECAKPTAADGQCLWFGNQPTKGVGVVVRGGWSIEPGPVDPAVPNSVFPVRVRGPVDFHLLAIWAQTDLTYVKAIIRGLDSYQDFLKAAPAVVVGDFNSHPQWDAKDRKANHSILAERLRREFGLVSAYQTGHAAQRRHRKQALSRKT